eukprot:UN34144
MTVENKSDPSLTEKKTQSNYKYGENKFQLTYLTSDVLDENKLISYPKCLHKIRLSDFNPPSGNRKLRGDILFIEILTLENETLYVSAKTDGFCINKSTPEKFDPEPRIPLIKDSSLLGLLLECSPLFRKNYRILLSRATETHPLSNLDLPFSVTNWCANRKKHESNCGRAENFLVDNFGAELRAPQRDWNEEYQSLVSIKQNTIEDKIIRDRCVFVFMLIL